ncbi:hypothetical protein [Methanocalculus sp.]|uniref:hypothetical protein n=1 Tax=Methanocalculus sp. TaxID=2004547 RepID=UPI002638B547|nr:hypothetical protein [Methanocalculus sp.]MDG6249969.1 hypothetical protein [Methanocalculus sp.]
MRRLWIIPGYAASWIASQTLMQHLPVSSIVRREEGQTILCDTVSVNSMHDQ